MINNENTDNSYADDNSTSVWSIIHELVLVKGMEVENMTDILWTITTGTEQLSKKTVTEENKTGTIKHATVGKYNEKRASF